MVQENGAAFNTNYLFRMVRADGSPLESYTRFPVLVMPAPVTFTQSDYRWFENADALAPGPALAAELTPFSTTTHGLTYRLRMNVEVDGLNLSAGFQAFRLQFSTSTAGGFSDVGDVGSAAQWRGFNNPSVADGATGGTALLSTSDVFESYKEQNPSVANPVAINIEERGEWDWVIQDNGAADDTTYFFRMVRAVGTPLDAYAFSPELTTAPAVVLDQKDFRWFSNLDDATPVDPLASENVALSAADPLVILRLRMNVESNGANVATGSRAFKLQYATSTAGLWTDLGAPSSTSTTFVGFDNPSVADGVALPSLKLTFSTVAQSYEEANPLTVVRLRINAAAAGDAVAAGEITLRLQYATSTGGVWRDLGTPGSAEIWRGFDNSLVDDGNAISTQLLDSTNVLETYEENSPSLSNPNAIPLGDRAEWDWVVQNNSAPTDTYVFRMIRDNGELLDGYVNFPQLTTVEPALVQRDFQWYPSSSVLNPATSTALAPVNGAATGAVPGAAFRIRMNVEASGFDLPATAQSFNLQFANITTGPWTDVGLLGSEGIWRGSDNAGLSDGATVSPILPSSDVGESYEEENPSVLNPNTILATTTQRGEWDWAIEDRLAPSGTFSFRMVREDGTTLDDYTNFPEIDAAGPSLAQEDYRWFANLDSTAPGSALAGENTLFTATEHVGAYRLRMNVEVPNSALIAGAQSFKLQYATSTPGPWSDVGAVGSNSDWWGFDNPSPADGSLMTTVLASSTVAATYEEFNPSVPNPNPVGAGDRAEWDWVLQPALVDSETTYYFRMVRAGGETLEVYTLFPSLTTPKALVLTQQDYRWFANTSTTTTPFVALSGENTSTTGAVPGDVFRLRMNVNVAGADMGAGSQAFKLQFTTSTSAPAGPWTDVGTLPPLQIGLGVCPRIRSWRLKPPRNNLLTVIWTLPWSN